MIVFSTCYLRHISNIYLACLTSDSRLETDDRILQQEIFHKGLLSNDGIAHYAIVDLRLAANGYVGSDYRTAHFSCWIQMYRWDDYSIPGTIRQRRLLQQMSVGQQECFLGAAVKPVFHWKGSQLTDALHHKLEGIGQLVLAPSADIPLEELPQTIK